MGKSKKTGRFWNFILIVGLICLLSGTVNGVRELINLRKVEMKLSEYMVTSAKGAKLELSECSIDSSVSVRYRSRSSGGKTSTTKAVYELLVPKEEVLNPKKYVFINTFGLTNSSAEFEKETRDSTGYHSIRGWIVRVSDPKIKRTLRELLNDTEAQIVLLDRGHQPVWLIYVCFAVAIGCFLILYLRALMKNIKRLISIDSRIKDLYQLNPVDKALEVISIAKDFLSMHKSMTSDKVELTTRLQKLIYNTRMELAHNKATESNTGWMDEELELLSDKIAAL